MLARSREPLAVTDENRIIREHRKLELPSNKLPSERNLLVMTLCWRQDMALIRNLLLKGK